MSLFGNKGRRQRQLNALNQFVGGIGLSVCISRGEVEAIMWAAVLMGKSMMLKTNIHRLPI
ncbi:uncharacterized protein FTOL_04669 [Fusarium torulosum]|uniref:Uncharacterized protein n=1 Tax=Fusarium torulosum TaxID=33205 RepID=A0AAE8SGC5_9HYPO|nr:uncharacterized protein FTOL_04669 [Fusarium torulosum]